jgi:hypothetical protein
MGPSNQLLYAANLDGNVYKVDPKTRTLLGTLTTGLSSPRDIAVGQDGAIYVASGSTYLYKVDLAGGVTTVTSLLGGSSYGGMDVDVDTGDMLVQSATGTDPLLRVARNGSSVTTVGAGFDSRHGITQHIPTGDVYSGSCCGDQSPAENVFRLTYGQTTATVWWGTFVAPVGVYSLKADRASAAAQRLVLGSLGSSVARGQGIYLIDLATKNVTQVTTITTSIYETEILYRRNLASTATGKGTWGIVINIPEDAGFPYVMGVSLSGVRPGLRLPDGRQINLTLDTFTVFGLQYGLAPFVLGSTGVLNAQGLAAGQLNLAPLGKAGNGLRVYFEVVTLDPKAPLGIRTITDPHGITGEGL